MGDLGSNLDSGYLFPEKVELTEFSKKSCFFVFGLRCFQTENAYEKLLNLGNVSVDKNVFGNFFEHQSTALFHLSP